MFQGQKYNPYIIDVEASGFGSSSYPIEVGIVLEPNVKFCTLITPAEDWQHWDPEAEKIHGISRDLLFKYGNSISHVAEQLNDLLKGKTVYSDGWVVDKPWIIRLFEMAQKEMTFHISPIEILLSEQQILLWDKTKQEILEQQDIRRHRASSDAWLIQETYNRTKNSLVHVPS